MSESEGRAIRLPLHPEDEKTAAFKILMIEDDARDVELIREMLASQNEVKVELESTDSLTRGIQRLKEWQPSVVLLDLSLPDGRGIKLVDQLQAKMSGTPVIVLTGMDDESVAIDAVRHGAQDYLVKGKVDEHLLLRAIRYSVERQHLLLDIRERKKDGEIIRASLKEKDALLKEIHHRVKNNLQIISSLLKLHTGALKDERDLRVFKDCQNKIKSMALVHEILYQSENLAKINFSDYIRKLAVGLFQSYGVSPEAVSLKVQAENVSLSMDTAIPCGLIVNELVSNSLKHAFLTKKTGFVQIVFSPDASGQRMTLTISDDGPGIPENFDIKKNESLGLRLVGTLTEQLGGTISFKREGGTEIKIVFPIFEGRHGF